MAKNTPKGPRDPNQLVNLVVDIATGEVQEESPQDSAKNPHAGPWAA